MCVNPVNLAVALFSEINIIKVNLFNLINFRKLKENT